MSCNCKSDIEARLLERFRSTEAQATGHTIELQGYALLLGGARMDVRGYMPVEASARHTTKSGTVRVKKQKQNMLFSYCPFCGVPVKDEDQE